MLFTLYSKTLLFTLTMAAQKVFIIEDDTLLCDLLCDLIDAERDLAILGTSGDGAEGLERCLAEKPDILITDVKLPGLNGIEVVQRLKQGRPEIKTLVLSGILNLGSIKRVLLTKADGILEKSAGLDEMRKALQAVAAGNCYYSADVIKRMPELLMAGENQGSLESLTSREREILQLIAEGHTTKEIAAKLEISTRTADVHRSHIMQKLSVHNVAGLTRAAIGFGLVDAPVV
jgi:DNA-binding NarL/FixJ family response regulator